MHGRALVHCKHSERTHLYENDGRQRIAMHQSMAAHSGLISKCRGELLSFWSVLKRSQAAGFLLLGYYILPSRMDQPIESTVNPVGLAARSRKRVWNTGEGRLKFIIIGCAQRRLCFQTDHLCVLCVTLYSVPAMQAARLHASTRIGACWECYRQAHLTHAVACATPIDSNCGSCCEMCDVA